MDIKLTDKKVTRDGMGEALIEIFQSNPNAIALSADIGAAFKLDVVKSICPDRYIECGICEQNMISVAAGMSYAGHEPICGSFAEFLPMRCLDQIRVSVCMNNANVIMIGGHAGLSYGGDGETIQAFEDISAIKSLPNLHIFVPSNANEAYEMTKLAFTIKAPVYLRITREIEQNFELENRTSLINNKIKSGEKIGIIGSGPFLYKSYLLAKMIDESTGINPNVYNLSYIKPYPVEFINTILSENKIIITLEDHQLSGGVGSIVTEVASENNPKPILRFGINGRFGECGTREEIDKELGVDLDTLLKRSLQFIDKFLKFSN